MVELRDGEYIIKIDQKGYFKLFSRYWSKVHVARERECWNWRGALSKLGYGQFGIGSKKFQAHRMSFLLANGSIDPGLYIDHMCMNHKCMNPRHLRAVTPRISALENTNGVAALNSKKDHCRNGHKYTKENTSLRSEPSGYSSRFCLICRKMREERKRNRARQTLKELGVE